MITFEDLMRKQAEIAGIAALMNGQTDAAKIGQLTAALQREAEGLQKMARTFEQEQQAKHGIQPPAAQPPTPEQQQAETAMRLEVEQILRQIANLSPAGADAVAKLRADPTFMGGLLAKK
jgi:hypothetical protein